MLISLKTLCQKYKFIPKGIIHVGAHQAEELSIYDSLGIKNVIWIEGNPDLYSVLQTKINTSKKHLFGLYKTKPFKKHLALNYLVSDQDGKEYEFKITNNGESSSILELDQHLKYHPHIHVVDRKILSSKKLDTIIKDHNIHTADYDFLNLDIQGAELLALKGFSKNLSKFKYIYTEVNEDSVYKDCPLITEIDDFLAAFKFKRVETQMTEFKWGDAFYIKVN